MNGHSENSLISLLNLKGKKEISVVANKSKTICKCGNPEYGFNCACEWMKNHKGNIIYWCEYCGTYTASRPQCTECEMEE